jgi:sensor histidine kinase regulating citrate/malate metabolism
MNKQLSLRAKLILIIVIKFIVFFLILRLFFFQDFLDSKFNSDTEKGDYVGDELINRK